MVGQLVQLAGIRETAKQVDCPGEPQLTAQSLNGSLAQLVEWSAEADRWVAATLDGQLLSVPARCLGAPSTAQLDGFDLIMGPKSNGQELARQMAELFAEKGHATLQVVLSTRCREEILEGMRELEAGGMLNRLPRGFESAYLGTGGKGKVLQFDEVSIPAKLQGTKLGLQAENLSMLSDLLKPHMKEAFGFSIHSRTPLTLRLPFADLEDEAKYFPATAPAAEADSFLELMGRRKVCVLQFLGLAPSRLTLVPRSSNVREVTVEVKPGSMVLFLADLYHFSCQTSSDDLLLCSWLLEPPKKYRVVTTLPDAAAVATAAGHRLPGPALPRGPTIAVTGVASRDPCNANTEEHFWMALRHTGCDGFLPIPSTRFDLDFYINYTDQQQALLEGRSYCRHQGHIEGIEIFDDKFFNIPTNECFTMDPEQRLTCEVGWGALQSAGFVAQELRQSAGHIGVYVGISSSDWGQVVPGCLPSVNGVPETFIANRFSYIMNLKGPSFISNTACSASLVATHAGKLHLQYPHDPLEGCMISGISLNTGPGTWVGNCSSNMLSFKGRSFSFNGSADGYGRGEGTAACFIKRGELSDEAYGLLAASHSNSDGRSASLTAPNGPAQQRLLKAILSEAGLGMNEVDTYEAHGTGTILGDPIEIGAVNRVIGKGRDNVLCMSCSKTNIGHLEGGAGMSGFVKCLQSVLHLEAIENQHLCEINPNLNMDGFPGMILTEGVQYRGDSAYVGVSGFGYGGTNAHCLAYGKKHGGKSAAIDYVAAHNAAIKKVQAAHAPDINMDSDNFEEWTTTGVPHLTTKANDQFHVELLPGGKTRWRELVEPELPSGEVFPFIQGSFNDWDAVMLENSEDIAGLFFCEVILGPSGEETFQLLLDADPDLALYPPEERCAKKGRAVVGPEVPPSREHAWLIRGSPGVQYRVEFFMSATTKTVSWIRLSD